MFIDVKLIKSFFCITLHYLRGKLNELHRNKNAAQNVIRKKCIFRRSTYISEFLKIFLSALPFRNLQHVETNSFTQRSAFSNRYYVSKFYVPAKKNKTINMIILNTKKRRNRSTQIEHKSSRHIFTETRIGNSWGTFRCEFNAFFRFSVTRRDFWWSSSLLAVDRRGTHR
jgi:hypothetical protein